MKVPSIILSKGSVRLRCCHMPCRQVSQTSHRNISSSHDRWRRRRVVVTGLGAITPLGADMHSTWQAVLRSDNNNDQLGFGITSLDDALKLQNLPPEQYEKEWQLLQNLSCQVAASVNSDWITNHPNAEKGGTADWNDGRTSRFVQLALIAAEEAVKHSGLDVWLGIASECVEQGVPNTSQDSSILQQRRESFGVSMGNGMSSTRDISMTSSALSNHSDPTKAHRKVSPHFVTQILPNSPSARIAIRNKLLGPNITHSEACAASAVAISQGVELIQSGKVNGMLVGGCESAVDAFGLIGFSRLRALSSGGSNGGDEAAQPIHQSSRPFDSKRDGFVLAEGAATLVLEEHEHAVSRGANILAEVVGVGYSCDGFHITAPEPTGNGAARAMLNAVQDADVGMDDVDYINAHATSTPVGDVAEIRAIRLALSKKETDCMKPLLVSSTKGATGHLLGAAGAIEAAFTVLAISDQVVPHTKNLMKVSDDIAQVISSHNTGVHPIHLVQKEPMPRNIDLAMTNSFGFGGTNASLLLAKYQSKC